MRPLGSVSLQLSKAASEYGKTCRGSGWSQPSRRCIASGFTRDVASQDEKAAAASTTTPGDKSTVAVSSSENEMAAFQRQLLEMKSRQLPVQHGRWDLHNIKGLRRALRSHLSLLTLDNNNTLPPGYHQVCFNFMSFESNLSDDGAEKLHEPNEDWRFRVWTGGHIIFSQPPTHIARTLPRRQPICQVAVDECISDVRMLGNLSEADAKVKVTLSKTFSNVMRDETGLSIRHRAKSSVAQKILNPPDVPIREEKHLLFMRNIPSNLRSIQAAHIPPPADPTVSQSMVPTPALLFRFSALTMNSHAIHLDTEYAQRVYGIPRTLVQGPLTSILMLDVLGEALRAETSVTSQFYAIQEFRYKNLQPIFVGERITICCKRVSDRVTELSDHIPREQWEVWIQKAGPEGPTLVVRGTATTSVIFPKDQSWFT